MRSFLHLEIGGVLDAVCAIGLAVGAGLQSMYLPHARSSCNNAHAWGASGDQPGIFAVLEASSGKAAHGLCINFVDAWSLSIVSV